MVYIVIIAHPEIGASFVSCVEHILAKEVSYVTVVDINKDSHSCEILAKAKKLVNKLMELGDVLILSDMFGATPSNIAHGLVIPNKVELINGLNLPMLIRAITYADKGLATCVEKALDGAQSGIVYVNQGKTNCCL